MIPWILVGVIVGATVTADVLQTIEMKRQGEVSDFRPTKLVASWPSGWRAHF